MINIPIPLKIAMLISIDNKINYDFINRRIIFVAHIILLLMLLFKKTVDNKIEQKVE